MNSRNSSETTRIADHLHRAFKGEAWHGPALLEILADVNAATAAARTRLAAARSICAERLDIVLVDLGGEFNH